MNFPLHMAAACLAAFLAGAINSVAGGGTLISFPVLLWLGLPSITANATNTVAIWPGSLGSLWGFRRELRQTEKRVRWLSVVCLFGGLAGAVLLRRTPTAVFDRLVPFLLLFATLLFTVQDAVRKRLGTGSHATRSTRGWMTFAVVFQLLVAIYGGYFGAGMSIMMLTSLAILGMSDILQMNALTSLFALCINGMAALLFIVTGMVDWRYLLPMAAAALAGGYGAAGLARRVGRTAVRRCVIGVGFAISVYLFVKTFCR